MEVTQPRNPARTATKARSWRGMAGPFPACSGCMLGIFLRWLVGDDAAQTVRTGLRSAETLDAYGAWHRRQVLSGLDILPRTTK